METQHSRRERLMRFLAGAAYVICIVPGNMILRLFRHDPMGSKPDPARATYWHKREEHGMSKPMKYPF